MEHLFDLIRKTRINFARLIEETSVEGLNEIPSGFGNNMIWNFAHIIASQQVICYQRANLETIVPEAFIFAYQAGSRPERFITTEEVDHIKELMISTIDHLENDWHAGVFKGYDNYTTRYGVTNASIEDGIRYFSTHDALHFGYTKAMKKILITK